MSQIHLICNAHIDPVWQWEWEEGAAAAVSTFRAAADFCEEFDDFVFCHNEALLYRWVEEYEPKLFARIQRLVKEGKWHIAGGWYLQPDCNMPGGESMVRQMQLGRAYFQEKFGQSNTTAINFDPFGHSRGLVQILAKAGYDSYLFMRPSGAELQLPGDSFMWVGYDGSEIMTHRINTGYNSPLGGAREKMENWLKDHPDEMLGMIPWGVGNHGGGPSRKDIADINALKAERPEAGLRHSTPERFFADLAGEKEKLGKVDVPLRPWGVGCYTSQIKVKQQHRRLESMLNQTERMLAHAAMAGLMEYPAQDILEAARDLCLSEFHDTLPGTSIQPVEENSLQSISHGLEIISRLRARAFFALSAGQKKAAPGEYPILVYNPFPYEIEQDVECEFMLADQNWKEEFTDMAVYRDGEALPGQIEKERSNLPLDWRKRVVFHAVLKPMQMNRFDCRAKILEKKPVATCPVENGAYVFENDRLRVEIGLDTGLIRRYCADGFDYLAGNAMELKAVRDSVDPWGMTVDRFREEAGAFTLMTPEESAYFAGIEEETLPPVRVIEDGPVRTVIEAFFRYKDSRAVLTYKLPKAGKAVEVGVRLQFAEKNLMVKLAVPAVLKDRYLGQSMFGMDEHPMDGSEVISQQWSGMEGDGRMLTLINDGVYGGDCVEGEFRTSIIRGAAYTAHPIGSRTILPQDRFTPRIDQGERLYRFVLEGGTEAERMENVSRQAQEFNEAPYALSFFPDGGEGENTVGAKITGKGVQLTAMRPALDGSGMILRLFDAAGKGGHVQLEIPLMNAVGERTLKPYEICTLKAEYATGRIVETDLLA